MAFLFNNNCIFGYGYNSNRFTRKEMRQTSWLSDNIKSLLAVIVTILGISYFYMCSIRDIKPDPQILIAIVGSLGTVLGYFFGSSSSSSKKDDALIVGANTPTVSTNADTTNVTVTKDPATS